MTPINDPIVDFAVLFVWLVVLGLFATAVEAGLECLSTWCSKDTMLDEVCDE